MSLQQLTSKHCMCFGESWGLSLLSQFIWRVAYHPCLLHVCAHSLDTTVVQPLLLMLYCHAWHCTCMCLWRYCVPDSWLALTEFSIVKPGTGSAPGLRIFQVERLRRK